MVEWMEMVGMSCEPDTKKYQAEQDSCDLDGFACGGGGAFVVRDDDDGQCNGRETSLLAPDDVRNNINML